MEQQYHQSGFNALVDWPYAKLAELWGGKGYICSTQKELQAALLDAKSQKMFCLIEVQVDETKPPQPLTKYISEPKPDTQKATEL